MIKHGIIYCRVSSKEQIEGTSLKSQESACREFARKNGVMIDRVFVRGRESAKFADRPELLELLDYCRKHKGELDTLFVWKLDRLARNVNDHFNIKAALLKYGVGVVSVTEPIDSKPEGKLLETILAGLAQFDNDVRAMRTVQGMRKKLQDGLHPWKAPIGYRTVTKGEKKTEPDAPVQPLFSLLQKAWKMFATGAYTKAEILRMMINWGVQMPNGAAPSHNFPDRFFKNTFYAGTVVDPWSGEEFEGKYTPMVTREEFSRVQQIISTRQSPHPYRRIRPEFPLRGLVRCPACERYMTASFSHGTGGLYPYYHCANRKCAVRKCHAAELIHGEFRRFLNELVPRENLVDALREIVVKELQEQQRDRKVAASRVKNKRDQVTAQIRELIRMRAQNLITDEEFRAEKAGLM